MSSNIPIAPQGNVPVIGIPDSQDIPRLVYAAPYFTEVPLAELIEPSVIEAVEAALPALVPPYVQGAAETAVSQLAVLLTGSTMSGPLFLSPLMPTQPSQAATMAYVDSMIATAGIPEVPAVPSGQVWARETGQWVPITPQTGVFLPLSGGSMVGNINMSGNTIQNMAAVPAMPNGAAPAQWVLNQIASVSLYQGTWNADTNTPDLTQLSTHVNAYTWIAITTAVGGVVIGAAIPGLQGMTIFNGDTIIYSTVQGQFMAIHAGGLTLPEADERYVQLAGSQMSGALLLNANASQPMQAVTFQQLQTFIPSGVVTEAPNDGQLYGRNGLTMSWAPVLPLAGGILTGSLTLFGNATANLNPVPLQQMTSAITAAVAGYLPLAGGVMSGLMSLSGNAAGNLNPVPLQQLNAMLASYLPLAGGSLTGPLSLGVHALTSANIYNSNAYGINAASVSGSFQYMINAAAGLIGAGDSNGISNALVFYVAPTGTAGAALPAGTTSVPVAALYSTGRVGLGTLAGGPVIYGSSQVSVAAGGTDNGIAIRMISTAAAYMVAFQNNTGGNVGYIQSTTTTTAYNTGSDRRLKTNINPVGNSGALIDALVPVTFNWLADPEAPVSYGFIAQDTQSVYPQAVSEGMGNPGDDNFMPWAMDNSTFAPLAIAELKALRVRVAALEAKAG